jgi:hypothetical protein
MFENIDAEAQFSYTHSDGTVISCKKAPSRVQASDDGNTLTKFYAEVSNDKMIAYMVNSPSSNPKEVEDLIVSTVPLSDIKFEGESNPFGITSSEAIISLYITHTAYVYSGGAKVDTEMNAIDFHFSTNEAGKAFINEVINNLPVAKREIAHKKFNEAYDRSVNFTAEQAIKNTEKEAKQAKLKQDIKQHGVEIEVGSKTLYIYGWNLYNGIFEKVATRGVNRITFDANKYDWADPNSFKKNGTTIYHNVKTVRDDRTLEIFRDGKKIGTCEKTMVSAENLPEPSEIAAILDYFGL